MIGFLRHWNTIDHYRCWNNNCSMVYYWIIVVGIQLIIWFYVVFPLSSSEWFFPLRLGNLFGFFHFLFFLFFWYPLSKSKLLDSQKSELLANFDEIGQGKPRITIFPRITMWGSNFLFHIRLRPPPSASVRLPPSISCLYQLVSINLSLSTCLYQWL